MFFNLFETYLAFSILFFIIFFFFLKKINLNLINTNLFQINKYLTILILLFSLLNILNIFKFNIYGFGFNYISMPIINFFKILILITTIFILLTVNDNLNKRNLNYFFPYGNYEFYFLILLNILGLCCFLSLENFLLIYLSIELHSLVLCILFGLRYNNKYSIESALKYFIVSSFSTILFLLGVGFIYSFYGTIDINILSIIMSFSFETILIYNYNIIIIAFALVIISILIKLGAAPFHMWSIDVYEGAPTFITLYALTVPKIAYIGFFFKVFLYFPNMNFLFIFLFKFSGLFSILIGTIGALIETKLKRILAYSAIANFGYILLCISFGEIENLIACLFYLLTYIIVTCNIFFIIFVLVNFENYIELKSIFDLKLLYFSGNKILSFLLCFLLFTLCSLPPSNIFFSKYLVLYSILEDINKTSILFIILIIFSSILGCFNYVRMIRLIFFNINEKKFSILFIKNSYLVYFIISLLSILNVLILFDSQFLLNFFEYIIIYL